MAYFSMNELNRINGLGRVGDWLSPLQVGLQGLGQTEFFRPVSFSQGVSPCWPQFKPAAESSAKQLNTELERSWSKIQAVKKNAMVMVEQVRETRIPPEFGGRLVGIRADVDQALSAAANALSDLDAARSRFEGVMAEFAGTNMCVFTGPHAKYQTEIMDMIRGAARRAESVDLTKVRAELERLKSDVARAERERRAEEDRLRREEEQLTAERTTEERRIREESERRRQESEDARRREEAEFQRLRESEFQREREDRAAAQQREDAERAAALQQAQAQAQAQQATQQQAAAARQAEAESAAAREERVLQLELARLEREMALEEARLVAEMQRLAAEEERASRREEREAQFALMRMQAEVALQAQAAGIPVQQQQAGVGPAGFAFAPGFVQQQPQVFGPRSVVQVAPPSASGSQFSPFQQPGPVGFQPPPGESFFSDQGFFGSDGMGALVRTLNPNLPPSSRVENGYKVHGPSGGFFRVERPDGSSFRMSTNQAFRGGAQVADPQTGEVFYTNAVQSQQQAQEVTAQDVAAGIRDVGGALAPLAASGISLAQQARGGEPVAFGQTQLPEERQGASTAVVVGAAVVGLGLVFALSRRKKNPRKRKRNPRRRSRRK